MAWDIEGRAGRLPASGGVVKVQEFDFKGENQVVYDENDVVIRSWPANHVIDGSVSYSLEWNGLKFVFGGDTYPNEWFVKYAKDADLAIHECFVTVPDLGQPILDLQSGLHFLQEPRRWAAAEVNSKRITTAENPFSRPLTD